MSKRWPGIDKLIGRTVEREVYVSMAYVNRPEQSEGKWVNRFPWKPIGGRTCVRTRDKTPNRALTLPNFSESWTRASFNLDSPIEPSHLEETNKEIPPLRSLQRNGKSKGRSDLSLSVQSSSLLSSIRENEECVGRKKRKTRSRNGCTDGLIGGDRTEARVIWTRRRPSSRSSESV